ncbi:hypothetical protein BHE74_00048800 [Ensete ventricosum]|nr:hypothetical protein BHE74_00048800 [Ensete ventricosum]
METDDDDNDDDYKGTDGVGGRQGSSESSAWEGGGEGKVGGCYFGFGIAFLPVLLLCAIYLRLDSLFFTHTQHVGTEVLRAFAGCIALFLGEMMEEEEEGGRDGDDLGWPGNNEPTME